MSKSQRLKNILDQAEGREKKYNWVEAAELYRQALGAVGKRDFLRKGEIQEKIGFCLHRAAFQAERQEEFKQRMQQAIEAYEKAHGFYEKLMDEQKAARMFRCDGIAKYLGYWLTSEPSEKRKLLDECLDLEGKALAAFSEIRDITEYGRAYNELPLVFWLRANLEWNRQTLKIILKDGIDWGEKAVATLSKLGDPYELAKAQFVLATCLDNEYGYGAHFIESPEEMKKNRLRVVKLLDKSVDLFEKVGDALSLEASHCWWAMNTGGEESVKHLERALDYGRQTRDNLLIAGSLDMLAYTNYWKALATEDPDRRKKLAKEAVQLNDKAQHYYSIISFISPRGGVLPPIGGHAEYYWQVAQWETDPKRTLELLEKSERAGTQALKLAEASGQPRTVGIALHVLSKTLLSLGIREPEVARKRNFLEKALKYREKILWVGHQLSPFDYFNRGVMQNYLGQIKSNLADIEPNFDRKKNLLKEAVTNMEKCLELCNKMTPWFESIGDLDQFAALQRYQEFYATLLTRLHNLTDNPEHLRKAIEILEKAIESASKLDLVSLMAASYWKIARTHDILEEHGKAAENFKHASECYLRAAEKIPQLEGFYQDHASYMEAWSEIETARYHHRRQEYGSAKEHFEKAADLHKSLRQWNYLAPNYSAWALVEHAEELSGKEQSEEALQAFEQAAQLFKETKKTLQTQRSKIEDLDEKQMATSMLKATDLRHEYCIARIALEEAKIFDKKGDHAASSEKYGSVVEAFEEISQALEPERDQKEFKFLISLSRAWQKMTLAEAEASPALYIEASKHFEKAKEFSPNEKSKMLMLGHSRFCMALEAGTRFEDTRDTTMYSTAKKNMEAAENYYLKAGFKSASEYAKATYMLFDAYMYLNQAQAELEPAKKAQYYRMAERLLQASAGSFAKAKHPEKSEHVQRLLESVKEKRQLAMSLTEVIHAPTITSTTTSFSTPTPTYEQAVGLERFEHADIQANLLVRAKEVTVGEDIDLEIELINAGKAPALLIKVEKVVPDGFEVEEVPEVYRVEDSFLNLKGKRLNPLKTEEVKIVVKPLSKGTFIMKPRIRYLDENGKYKSHQPEPVTITVKELGIKGWIKGKG